AQSSHRAALRGDGLPGLGRGGARSRAPCRIAPPSRRGIRLYPDAGPMMSPPISPALRDAWHVVHQTDPYALESQSPAWTDAMCDGGAYEDASRCYDVDGRVMVLPMLRRKLGGIVAFEAANP